MDRFLKMVVLLLLGVFLYSRVINGIIAYYIHERFFMLTLVAGVGFLLLGASYGREWMEEATAVVPPTHDDHDHGAITWPGLLIITLPLILGWLVPPRPLGAAAVGNREINFGNGPLSSIAVPGGNAVMGIVSDERNILDWLREFQQVGNPAQFNGQEATIIGFVYRDGRFTADTFMVARFTVSCCVADAAPVGLIVRWPNTSTLADDQWVEVQGHFELRTFNGIQMPILVADTITLTEQPRQPYLYL